MGKSRKTFFSSAEILLNVVTAQLSTVVKKVLKGPEKIWTWYQKYAEFYADSETVEKYAINYRSWRKSYRPK
jgi:hypothetical protein